MSTKRRYDEVVVALAEELMSGRRVIIHLISFSGEVELYWKSREDLLEPIARLLENYEDTMTVSIYDSYSNPITCTINQLRDAIRIGLNSMVLDITPDSSLSETGC